MAVPKLQIRRSAVQGSIPTTSQLSLGELAINTYDGKLFLKKNVEGSESIVQIGAVSIDANLVDILNFTSGVLSADDAGSDKLVFWDDSASKLTHLTVGTGLSISETTLSLESSSYFSESTVTRSSISQFVADSFSSVNYRTTKYIIEVRETSTANFYSTEVLIMHDGATVYMTEYATLSTTISPVSSIDADISSGNVRLLITPAVVNTTTKISRISLTA